MTGLNVSLGFASGNTDGLEETKRTVSLGVNPMMHVGSLESTQKAGVFFNVSFVPSKPPAYIVT